MIRLTESSAVFVVLVAAAWAGNAAYAFAAPDSLLKWAASLCVAISMLSFFVAHSCRTLGPQQTVIFIIVVSSIAWSAEAIGMHTGLPFGDYTYTDLMWPFIGSVPVLVMLVYCVMGYNCWIMAFLLLHRFGNPIVPLVFSLLLAAILMVVWDLPMDPLRSTIEGRWVWHSGGQHFGVPLINYFGWALVTWLMFQSLVVINSLRPSQAPRHAVTTHLWFWLSVPLMYLAFPVEHVLNPFVAHAEAVQLATPGVTIPVHDIFLRVALLTLITMVPVALFAMLQIRKSHRDNDGDLWELQRAIADPRMK